MNYTNPDGSIPTARELASIANGNRPWECPDCGCNGWKTIDTRWRDGGKRRERRCLNPHCNRPLPTMEFPIRPGFKIVEVEDDASKECA